jgi:predicted DNA-binding transcriptional regulator AlpA
MPRGRMRTQDEDEPGPLVGLAEAADLLGVTKRTATDYTKRGDFPAPVQRLAATPVWKRAEVAAWAADKLPLTRGRPASSAR